jgi:lipid A 3-O-deacylase
MADHKSISLKIVILPLLLLLAVPGGFPACQSADWVSTTWDNDVLFSSDDGYTHGAFFSWFDTGRRANRAPEPPLLIKPLLWSMSAETDPLYTVNAYTLGQMMVTPEDISRRNPDPNDIPYSGLLYYFSSHLQVYEDYADMASVTLGIIGPASGAKATQEFFHKHVAGNNPKGWGHQLDNELVFKLSRDRVWRHWVAEEGNADFLWLGDINVGTLESSVGGYAIIRYGTGLAKSYATAAYRSSRAINSLALDGNWHVYCGVGTRYIGNLIFTDGNTYEDSPSVDLDKTQAGVSFGASYSWRDIAVGVAVEDNAYFEDRYKGISRYGTLTFAYRLE